MAIAESGTRSRCSTSTPGICSAVTVGRSASPTGRVSFLGMCRSHWSSLSGSPVSYLGYEPAERQLAGETACRPGSRTLAGVPSVCLTAGASRGPECPSGNQSPAVGVGGASLRLAWVVPGPAITQPHLRPATFLAGRDPGHALVFGRTLPSAGQAVATRICRFGGPCGCEVNDLSAISIRIQTDSDTPQSQTD